MANLTVVSLVRGEAANRLTKGAGRGGGLGAG